jgi:Xaa-Pro aminopeptidase
VVRESRSWARHEPVGESVGHARPAPVGSVVDEGERQVIALRRIGESCERVDGVERAGLGADATGRRGVQHSLAEGSGLARDRKVGTDLRIGRDPLDEGDRERARHPVTRVEPGAVVHDETGRVESETL